MKVIRELRNIPDTDARAVACKQLALEIEALLAEHQESLFVQALEELLDYDGGDAEEYAMLVKEVLVKGLL